MEGPRSLFDHELAQFVDFLSTQLRPGQSWSIADEYPLAIHDANLNNVRVIKEQENFLSAAVMKPLIVKSPAGLFKVAAIGSVVTAPDHRNRGLSKQVLEDCLAAATRHGCDFAILWTNLFDFYRKLGFELAGTEISFEIPTSFTPPAPPAGAKPLNLRFLNSNKIDAEAMLRLYNQHTTGSVRNADEVRKFLQIPNAHVFTAWDDLNRLQAYAVEGKGADFANYIHEWGGGVSKLVPLLAHIVRERGRPITLISPKHSANLIRQLREGGAKEHSGVLGMIKLLNPAAVLTKMKKYTRLMGVDEIVLEAREGCFYLGHKQEIFRTDSTVDIVRLLFGPQKASELQGLDQTTAQVFEQLFPIPMWIWGWDSV